jgi:hypothetical protein
MVSCPLERRAGALGLPLKHFLLASVGLLAFAAALFAGRARLMGFDVDARFALGCAHLLTLGCVTATILGVMTQMIPGHGGVPLRWPWAPRAALWLLAGGLAGFVGALWTGVEAYWIPAAALAAALALYLASLLGTLARASRDVTARHFAAALSALALVALLGAGLAVDRQRGLLFPDGDGALVAHVHLALVGFVSLTILGGSYRLFSPMALARAHSRLPSRAAALLLAGGTLGLAVDALWFGRSLARLWAALLAAGFAAFASQLVLLLRTKAELDLPSAYALLGMAGGALWCALGLGLAFGAIEDRWESRAAYALAALLGWALPWILGQTYKIMPFLVWRSACEGREGAPAYDELLLRPLAWAPLPALALGVPALAAGFLAERQAWLSVGAALVLAAALAHFLQAVRLVRFVLRSS